MLGVDLDLAVVDLPIRGSGISALSVYTEPLIAWLPEGHPLAVRPMVRSFDLKREQFVLLSGSVDPGSAVIRTIRKNTAHGDLRCLTRAGFSGSDHHFREFFLLLHSAKG
jgi:DNA-binding transcriptional LysR family regulator